MKNLALLPLLLLSLAAHADEREWHPYKKLVEDLRLDKFYALPAAERDKVNLYLTIKPQNKNIKPSEVVLTVVHGSERQQLPALSPDYRMAFVPNPKWMTDDTKILTSLPKEEKSKVDYDATTPLPEGLQWNYAPVMSSVGQMNQAIKKMAGALSMFAPSVKVVVFKFNHPAQLKVGSAVFNTDAKNQIKLKPDSALLKENPLMVASERPFEAELDSE
ncbi:hypothetical protein GTP46_26255 [Duganella sp. FT135W]|uniref:DUF2987 domain-containing protein n=1 Tax=Duganella flavida TaxID=2692175 RepID=A0A6L8KFA3_9BURK|nr:hypothetical protein [Duganella flavida]MYM26139.1 hypothetical protein [Duganella flavida]